MSSAGQPTTRLGAGSERWEYRVSTVDVAGFFGPTIDGDKLATYLNEAGDQGWELVNIVSINHGQGSTSALLMTLKRRA